MHRRKFITSSGAFLAGIPLSRVHLFGLGQSDIWQSALSNPTLHNYVKEPVNIKAGKEILPDEFSVWLGQEEAPYQIGTSDSQPVIWVAPDLPAQSSQNITIAKGLPRKYPPLVEVRREGDYYILKNKHLAVRVPAAAGSGIPGPFAGIQMSNGQWVGRSFWKAQNSLAGFTAEVTGDGAVFGEITLRYDFAGLAGAFQAIPSFAEIRIRLAAEWRHVQFFEKHEMQPGDTWVLEMSHGWGPLKGIGKPFDKGPGGDGIFDIPPAERPLLPVRNRSFEPGLFINLLPRWNQHFKDGWAFTASDGEQRLSAIALQASQWVWPHNNSLKCMVKPEGNYAGIHCSSWKGQRLWWLAPSSIPVDPKYLSKFAWENPDKVNREYILDWPGKTTRWWRFDPYDAEQVNPTHRVRQTGKAALKNAGMPAEDTTLIRFQTLIHPDSFGSYWNYFSPENPNFFTDFNLVPLALATNLKGHQHFDVFRKMAEDKFREDIYHSITMPSGAGQECPGYLHYALGHWKSILEMGVKHLGFEQEFFRTRIEAAERFYERLSFPDGEIRRGSPMGDSHPARQEKTGMPPVEVDKARVSNWTSEELQGFGVVFSNKPGTEEETYLSFKSGPNRCHYHGDQLAFHYCARGRPLVVDHHCSYHPRAGQEHMHNRMAFFTRDMPFANMDGYEHLLAFKTSAEVDVAVGQVESHRLREVLPLPPEAWDGRYPQIQFSSPLIYRRTVVLVKNGPQDYFVFRDQYWSDRPVHAAFCLHTYGDRAIRRGNVIDFGKLQLFCTHPHFTMKNFEWSHENGGREETKGVRLEMSGPVGDMVTVLYPGNQPPKMKAIPGGVQVGKERILFGGDQPVYGDSAEIVQVRRQGKSLLSLSGTSLDFDRWQGEIGLFIPDAGYPFGEIPDWLARQRAGKPEWAKKR